ncbi:MAG: four helix bundle protein [Bacteroidales bacterium]|nr:four helix bundle protein [Bacteroidales bacterium]
MNEEKNNNKKFDLENRLIEFSVFIITITENIFNTRAGNHIAGQIVKSGTSPALNYGEAQSAESRNDFIHKLKIILKELRETLISLKIIKRVPLTKGTDTIEKALVECNELIAIFKKVSKLQNKII